MCNLAYLRLGPTIYLCILQAAIKPKLNCFNV